MLLMDLPIFFTIIFEKTYKRKLLFPIFILISLCLLIGGIYQYFVRLYTEPVYSMFFFQHHNSMIDINSYYDLSIDNYEKNLFEFKLNSIEIYIPEYSLTLSERILPENVIHFEPPFYYREEEIAGEVKGIWGLVPDYPDEICFPDFEIMVFYNRLIDRFFKNLPLSLGPIRPDLNEVQKITSEHFCIQLKPMANFPGLAQDPIYDLNHLKYFGELPEKVFPAIDFSAINGFDIEVYPFDEFQFFIIPSSSFNLMKDGKTIASFNRAVFREKILNFDINISNPKWNREYVKIDEPEFYEITGIPKDEQLLKSNVYAQRFNKSYKYVFKRTYPKFLTILSFLLILICIFWTFTITDTGNFIQSLSGIFFSLWGIKTFLIETPPASITFIDILILLYIIMMLMMVVFKILRRDLRRG